MEWNESADETSRVNSNTRTETVLNILIPHDYLGFYGSTPGKTTTLYSRGVEQRLQTIVSRAGVSE